MAKANVSGKLISTFEFTRNKRCAIHGELVAARVSHSKSSTFPEMNQTPSISVDLRSIVQIDNVKFRTFGSAASGENVFSCSWSEATLLHQTQNAQRDVLCAFTERHILRCYPAGSRIMSGNFDPSMAWSIGAQMVALNFQANDEPIWINRGKYLANGACGFIRKPDYLNNNGLQLLVEPILLLEITVLACSGWDIFLNERNPSMSPDTCICISLSGSKLDTESQMTSVFSSRAQTGPCAQPYYNETFNFQVFEPELSVLLITVYDKSAAWKYRFLAQSSSPVALLRPGIRLVPLYDKFGKYVGKELTSYAPIASPLQNIISFSTHHLKSV